MMPDITVNVGSAGLDYDDTRPMEGFECLKRWGTMSIGIDVMLDRIRVGGPTVYDLADGSQVIRWDRGNGQINAWLFMQFVPESFHDIAMEGLRRSLEKHQGWKISSHIARDFVHDAHLSILRQLEARERFAEFCEEWRRIGSAVMHDAGITAERAWRATEE
jgi:hypothetical protein